MSDKKHSKQGNPFLILFNRTKRFQGEIKKYLLLLLLPLILGIILFFSVMMVIRSQIEAQGSMTAMRFETQASNIFHEMKIVSDSLQEDASFMKNISEADPSAYNPLDICSAINGHLHESAFVSHAYLLCESQNHIYTDNAYYLYAAKPVILDSILSISDNGGSTEAALPEDGWHILNTNYAAPFYVVTIHSSENTSSTLIVVLNKTEFIRSFYNINAEMCCLFNQSFSISSLLKNSPGIDWTSSRDVSEVAGTPVRCFYINGDDFTYMVAISTHEFYKPLWIILYVFLGYFSAVLIIGFIYLSVLSRKRYDTVASLIKGLPNAPSGNDSSYEEMISTMSKSLDEYKNRIDSDQERLYAENLRIFLLGAYAYSVSDQQLQMAGLATGYKRYCVAAFFLHGVNLIFNTQKETASSITRVILSSALLNASGRKIHVSVTDINHSYFAVLCLNDESLETVRRYADTTITLLEKQYGFESHVIFSDLVSNPCDLSKAYNSIQSLNEFAHSIDSTPVILTPRDLDDSIGVVLSGGFLKEVQILSSTLLLGKYELVPSMVAVILDEHVTKLGKHYQLANERIAIVANILSESIISAGFSKEDGEPISIRLRQVHTVQELNTAVQDIFGEKLKSPSTNAVSDIVQKSQKYIEDNISNANLSVPDVCSDIGVSVQHLSRLFRKYLNMTVVEYINEKRIEEAKRLLLENIYTVAKIAEMTGYNNTVTFMRNFHRYVGLSPTEYRNLNLPSAPK